MTKTQSSLGNLSNGATGRQGAHLVLREMAERKRKEAEQLDALADIVGEINPIAEEALWSLAVGYLHR